MDTTFPTTVTLPRIRDTVAFARTLKALDWTQLTVNQDALGGSIDLPLLTSQKLQERFRVKGRSVSVILRKCYRELYENVVGLQTTEWQGLYLTGPKGVGKSYLLYLLVSQLRQNTTYRVTYINQCRSWRIDPYAYILHEFVITFHDDGIGIDARAEAIIAADTPGTEIRLFRELMQDLHEFTRARDLHWFLIIDEYNSLYSPSNVVEDEPFAVVYRMFGQDRKATVVVSGLANNEPYPTEIPGWYVYDIGPHCLDDDEYSTWCKIHLGSTISQPILSEIRFWTGGVPLELAEFLKSVKLARRSANHDISAENLAIYIKDRVRAIAAEHSKFSETCVSAAKQESLRQCVASMALCIEPPNTLSGMNRQLLHIEQGKYGEVLAALNPIYRRVLLRTGGHDTLRNEISLVATVVLNGSKYPTDAKGRIVEWYIISLLEINRNFLFQGINAKKRCKNTFEFQDRIEDVVYFGGHGLPLETSFDKRRTTLFVPKSTVYPEMDFFIWLWERNEMLALQVTLVDSVETHVRKRAKKEQSREAEGKKHSNTGDEHNDGEVECVGRNDMAGSSTEKQDAEVRKAEGRAWAQQAKERANDILAAVGPTAGALKPSLELGFARTRHGRCAEVQESGRKEDARADLSGEDDQVAAGAAAAVSGSAYQSKRKGVKPQDALNTVSTQKRERKQKLSLTKEQALVVAKGEEESVTQKWATWFGIERKSISVLWLIPQSCDGGPFVFPDDGINHYYVYFSSMENMFPALKHLAL